MSMYKKQLKNGIVFIAETVPAAKTAAVGFWFPVGSLHEHAERTFVRHCRGASHFVEHMLFKGTESKSAYDIARSFDSVGGYVNAFTERDVICLYAVVPAVYLDSVLSVLCEMVTGSVFDNAELEKERSVIKSEIITSQDDPEEAAFDVLYRTLWPSQPLSQPVAGSVHDVQQLTRDDIVQWYETYCKNGTCVVTVSGSCDPAAVEPVLERLPPRTASGSLYTAPKPVWKSGLSFVQAPFRQNQIFLAYPVAAPYTERKSAAWMLLNALTGDTMSSRLFQRLREKKAYCYSVYSFVTNYEQAVFWCAYVSVEKKNTAGVIEELSDEIACLVRDGITEKELEDAKKHVIGEEIIASEDVESRMKRLARLYFSGFALAGYDDSFKMLESVSASDIRAEIKEVFTEQTKSLLVYGRKYER